MYWVPALSRKFSASPSSFWSRRCSSWSAELGGCQKWTPWLHQSQDNEIFFKISWGRGVWCPGSAGACLSTDLPWSPHLHCSPKCVTSGSEGMEIEKKRLEAQVCTLQVINTQLKAKLTFIISGFLAFATEKGVSPTSPVTVQLLGFLQSEVAFSLSLRYIKVHISILLAPTGQRWIFSLFVCQFFKAILKTWTPFLSGTCQQFLSFNF